MGVKSKRLEQEVFMPTRKLGLYVSYNDKKNGRFSDAVDISNDLGCLTWFNAKALDPIKLKCPTGIIVRIKGGKKYYRGVLLAVARADKLTEGTLGESNHRPVAWKQKDKEGHAFKSVLFINGLREIEKPEEVQGRHPPQSPTYIELEYGV
jgi:hypothetical protein